MKQNHRVRVLGPRGRVILERKFSDQDLAFDAKDALEQRYPNNVVDYADTDYFR